MNPDFSRCLHNRRQEPFNLFSGLPPPRTTTTHLPPSPIVNISTQPPRSENFPRRHRQDAVKQQQKPCKQQRLSETTHSRVPTELIPGALACGRQGYHPPTTARLFCPSARDRTGGEKQPLGNRPDADQSRPGRGQWDGGGIDGMTPSSPSAQQNTTTTSLSK